MKARSTSSLDHIDPRQKWGEAFALLSMRRDAASRRHFIEGVLTRIDRLRSDYERLTGRSFAEARVFEIGYGAQPFRIIALMSMGIAVQGIDLDMPMLRFSPGSLTKIFARNGWERALKTGVRSLLFDRRDYADLESALQRRGYSMHINPADLLVGDAAAFDFGPQSLDLVYSQDVFEHIPREGIENTMARLATRLAPNGLALITPNIFTGIPAAICPNGTGIPRKIILPADPSHGSTSAKSASRPTPGSTTSPAATTASSSAATLKSSRKPSRSRTSAAIASRPTSKPNWHSGTTKSSFQTRCNSHSGQDLPLIFVNCEINRTSVADQI